LILPTSGPFSTRAQSSFELLKIFLAERIEEELRKLH
jgi:hypothetical protein